ETII
ncbi:nrfE domain protein, partial [Vibrio parahaemolyticus EKP-028]